MDLNKIPFRELSTVAILIPIGFNIRALRTAGPEVRLFLPFLLAGLVADLTEWFMAYRPQYIDFRLYISVIYSLIESFFFVWFIHRSMTGRSLPWRTAAVVAAACLCVIIPLSNNFDENNEMSYTTFFDSFYHVFISVLAGFALLYLTEASKNILGIHTFWILTGFFFYCFCTFFIFVLKSIIPATLASELWFLHNIINIITYGLYSRGLWQSSAGG